MSKVTDQKTPIDVFFAYSHEDERLRDELEKQLSILKRQGVIRGWHDRRISPGEDWQGKISKHLYSAEIILLLISHDFLASDYCYDVELPVALQRHESGEARVIPILLRAVDLTDAPFSKLQALPMNAIPVTSWPNRDEALKNVAQGIREAVNEYSKQLQSKDKTGNDKRASTTQPASDTANEEHDPVTTGRKSPLPKPIYHLVIMLRRKRIWKFTIAFATAITLLVYFTGKNFPEYIEFIKNIYKNPTKSQPIPSLINELAQIQEFDVLRERLESEQRDGTILIGSREEFEGVDRCYLFVCDAKSVLAVFFYSNAVFQDIRTGGSVENLPEQFRSMQSIWACLRSDVYRK